jgi:hypothetical protein
MEDSIGTCDYCKSACSAANPLVQLFTPLPFGTFCKPECAAAFNQYRCLIDETTKQSRHNLLEKYWKRKISISHSFSEEQDTTKKGTVQRFRK